MEILVAGDYVPRNRINPLVKDGNYEEIFGNVQGIVKSADYSIINFESPVTEEGDKPISKSGPNLQCTAKAVDAIKYAGFDCATLANNHIRDFGSDAVNRTIKLLKDNGLDSVGAGKNIKEAAKTLYKDINGERLAIINCAEHEFSIASEEMAGANPLNPIQQYYAIREAKEKADCVLVIIHGGHELHQLPSPRMQEIYRFFIDAGADAVVNGHQHCFSGYEVYKEKPIFYGLGNFCMDKSPIRVNQPWNYGYMVKLSFNDGNIVFELIPYEQCGEKPGVFLLKDRTAFDKRISELNKIIVSNEALKKATDDYYKSTEKKFIVAHEPYSNIWLKKLFSLHLLPSFMSKKRMLNILNFIECESQRDRQIIAIKHKLNIE